MATMRDVAKLAGVSHGTVSNVINGSPGVSLDKIQRVQAAMRQLGYKQNTLARIMRSREADNSLHVILPNLENSLYSYIYQTLNQLCADAGAHVNLWLTGDKPYLEQQILSNAQAFNMSNAVLVTCQPENTQLFDRLRQEGVHMLFLLRQVKGHRFLSVDMRPLLEHTIAALSGTHGQRIALITGPREYAYDLSCIDGYMHAFLKYHLPLHNEYIVSTENTISGFLYETTRLLSGPNPPAAIIVTDDHSAEGVRQAIRLAGPQLTLAPELVIYSGNNWPSSRSRETSWALPARQIAVRAFEIMLQISSPETRSLPLAELLEVPLPVPRVNLSSLHSGDTIRVLLLDANTSAVSVRALIGDFTRRTGIHVEMDARPYGQLLETIEQSDDRYDAFAIDLAWASELNSRNYVEPLTPYLAGSGIVLDAFLDRVLREYCFYDGIMYALPFSYTAQLLLYRKDLFDSLKSKRHFFEMTGKQLQVPKTWEEYNEVARFFTRSYNPESETRYGTTMGGNEYNGAALEFFPRLWSITQTSADGAWTDLRSSNALKAFQNYTECFRYAQPDALNCWWDEEVNYFANGDAAMMIIFSEHAASLWERSHSSITGKVGHSLVPGGISVLGGWGLAVNRRSRMKKQAFEFLKWSCAPSLAIPNAALGRIIPYRFIREDAALTVRHPWLTDAFNAFDHIGRRRLNALHPIHKGTIPDLERAVGRAVRDAVTGRNSPEFALLKAAEEFDQLLQG